MENQVTDPINHIYATGDSDSGLVHAGEAPPAGYAFHPVAHCGAVMTGDRLEKRPSVDDLCASDAKWLGIDKPAADAPAEKKPAETKPADSKPS